MTSSQVRSRPTWASSSEQSIQSRRRLGKVRRELALVRANIAALEGHLRRERVRIDALQSVMVLLEAKPTGLMALIHDEVLVPNASDANLLTKMNEKKE